MADGQGPNKVAARPETATNAPTRLDKRGARVWQGQKPAGMAARPGGPGRNSTPRNHDKWPAERQRD
eukprot:7258161-Pyramimonas_sp.AAC.1